MCDPVSIGMALMAVVSAANANKQSVAAEEAQAQASADNKVSADAAARSEHQQLNLQQNQEQAAAADEKQSNKLETMRTLGTVRTSAGESGVAGGAVQSLLRDVNRQNSARTLSINRNLSASTSQFQVDRDASAINHRSRINSTPMPISGSSSRALSGAVTLGRGALGAYQNSQGG